MKNHLCDGSTVKKSVITQWAVSTVKDTKVPEMSIRSAPGTQGRILVGPSPKRRKANPIHPRENSLGKESQCCGYRVTVTDKRENRDGIRIGLPAKNFKPGDPSKPKLRSLMPLAHRGPSSTYKVSEPMPSTGHSGDTYALLTTMPPVGHSGDNEAPLTTMPLVGHSGDNDAPLTTMPLVGNLWDIKAQDPLTSQIPLESTGHSQIQSSTTRSGRLKSSRTESDPFSWTSEVPESELVDAALAKSRRRNLDRLSEANDRDKSILGKYLPNDASVFFPFGLASPDDFKAPSEGWLQEVISVASSPCQMPSKPHIRLGTDVSSLLHNTRLLEECEWCVEQLFDRLKGTTVDHGSEFRPTHQLQRIVGMHPNFEYLRGILENGFEYILSRELSEAERRRELEAQLERGNHRSAIDNEEEIQQLLEGDVKYGFVLPFSASEINNIKGVQLQPGGMVRQMSLKADGSRKPKTRFTHDLSFSITFEEASINSRIVIEAYPDMVYGWCLSRILHRLAAMRYRHPGVKIFISKYDFSDAYKRISQSPQTSAKTVIKFGEVAYLCWRMVFGGSPNPAGFSSFSEMLTDLANELGMSSYTPDLWRCPTVEDSHLVVRETEDPSDPVCDAILPALEAESQSDSFRDCFIDDVIDCHLDTEMSRKRSGHLVPLAVHAMTRPHGGDEEEPVPRRPILGSEKLQAEGRSAERQIVLGWEVCTRSFSVSLPLDKHRAWKEDIKSIVQSRSATIGQVESLVGRLNHASFVIPLGGHFLNDLRMRCQTDPKTVRRQKIRLSEEEIKDLNLWEELLDLANRGISINLLVVRTPTRIAWSDSCPYGLGGYTLGGFAWRIRVPKNAPFYGDDSANNVLEFLGMAVSILLLLRESRQADEKFPCLLVLGDNTSAISWIFRSGKIPKNSAYRAPVKHIARHIALQTLSEKAKVCSQHIAGETNTVADLLSYEGGDRGETINPLTKDCPPNDVLTNRLHSSHSQLIPTGFQIQQLPEEIESFVLSSMQIISKSWDQKGRQHSKRGTGTGGDGALSSTNGGWEATPTSIRYPVSKKDFSSQEGSSPTIASITSTRKVKLLRSVRGQWYRELFSMPLALWHRRSGNVEGAAPSTSRTESMLRDRCIPESVHSYKPSSEKTNHQKGKRR